jgi:hypothetical protein
MPGKVAWRIFAKAAGAALEVGDAPQCPPRRARLARPASGMVRLPGGLSGAGERKR